VSLIFSGLPLQLRQKKNNEYINKIDRKQKLGKIMKIFFKKSTRIIGLTCLLPTHDEGRNPKLMFYKKKYIKIVKNNTSSGFEYKQKNIF
jgi:hypothetical protein